MQKKLFIGFLTLLLGGLFLLQLGLLPAQATAPLTYPITNPLTYPVIDYPTPPTDYPITYPITYPLTYVEPTPIEESSVTPTVSLEPQKSNSGNSQNSSNGSSNSNANNHVCTTEKPKSAPYLVSAVKSGKNQVTLFWNKAWDPVSHYSITYGTVSGKEQYSVLNAGGKDAMMYTIDSLYGGTTYYFRVRGVNGCAYGEYSNEVGISASGKVIKNTGVKNKVMGASVVNKAKQVVKNTVKVTKANKKSVVFDVSDNRIVKTAKSLLHSLKGLFSK